VVFIPPNAKLRQAAAEALGCNLRAPAALPPASGSSFWSEQTGNREWTPMHANEIRTLLRPPPDGISRRQRAD